MPLKVFNCVLVTLLIAGLLLVYGFWFVPVILLFFYVFTFMGTEPMAENIATRVCFRLLWGHNDTEAVQAAIREMVGRLNNISVNFNDRNAYVLPLAIISGAVSVLFDYTTSELTGMKIAMSILLGYILVANVYILYENHKSMCQLFDLYDDADEFYKKSPY